MKLKDDKIHVPDNVDSGVIIPEYKPYVNLFATTCTECKTVLNGSTICPNCGKDQKQ